MAITRLSTAWLITWEGTDLKLTEERKVAEIVGSRRSANHVAEIVEFLYECTICNALDMAHYANRRSERPFSAQRRTLINGVPHGDRITCGHNPFLYGRKVLEFQIVLSTDGLKETLTWQEPNNFRWADEGRQTIEAVRPGRKKEISRPTQRMLLPGVPF